MAEAKPIEDTAEAPTLAVGTRGGKAGTAAGGTTIHERLRRRRTIPAQATTVVRTHRGDRAPIPERSVPVRRTYFDGADPRLSRLKETMTDGAAVERVSRGFDFFSNRRPGDRMFHIKSWYQRFSDESASTLVGPGSTEIPGGNAAGSNAFYYPSSAATDPIASGYPSMMEVGSEKEKDLRPALSNMLPLAILTVAAFVLFRRN